MATDPSLWSLPVGPLAIGVVVLVLAAMIRNGELPRNRAVGIKTRATLASDQAWEAGHRAALPWMLRLGWTCLGVALVLVTVLLVGVQEVPALILFGVVMVVLLLFSVPLTIVSNRAARAAESRVSGNTETEGASSQSSAESGS